ncbi:uncharacterized protein LOC129223121 [Uloborus diversus]|uniref:uncharacterized protein LOC129223121 n=1 Tax=Uloborus diversus TaxID=327109 RepID=UPI0024091698|nr:uncharacterized protein LOC129223121 [Uloborus diversus]
MNNDNENASAAGNTNNGTVSAVTIKLPAFWRANPELWFIQLDSQFKLANITAESTKFHHVVSALQPEELAVVGDIILQPPSSSPYTALKTRLCQQYAESETERFKSLISGMQLGDKKPSRLLLEMRSKSPSHISEELLKTLFLQRLPVNAQQILAISSDDLDKLAMMADGIIATDNNCTKITAVSSDQQSVQDMLHDISSRLSRLEMSSRSRDKSPHFNPKRRRSQSRNRKHFNGLCWYHYRFQDKANKCIMPCTYSSEN